MLGRAGQKSAGSFSLAHSTVRFSLPYASCWERSALKRLLQNSAYRLSTGAKLLTEAPQWATYTCPAAILAGYRADGRVLQQLLHLSGSNSSCILSGRSRLAQVAFYPVKHVYNLFYYTALLRPTRRVWHETLSGFRPSGFSELRKATTRCPARPDHWGGFSAPAACRPKKSKRRPSRKQR